MKVRAALMAGLLMSSCAFSEEETGSICVAPAAAKPTLTGAHDGIYCGVAALSLKIDDRTMAWPAKKKTKIDGLDATARHRVVIQCDARSKVSFGASKVSFFFRFTGSGAIGNSTHLCMYIDDFYKNVRLWDLKNSPWCKCD